jgi:hypothetical protein
MDHLCDGGMARGTIARKWRRLLTVNTAMKVHFGVIDRDDLEDLREMAELLGDSDVGSD